MGEALSRRPRLGGVPGHSEGWAVYAERLADELGWFAEPGTPAGHAQGLGPAGGPGGHRHRPAPGPAAAAARGGPARPTVDIRGGARGAGDRGRIAAHRLHAEVVRYCGWPAQATGYKLGERAWLAAREEARARLGAGFDLKRWHTAALALGPVQLGDLAAALRTVS